MNDSNDVKYQKLVLTVNNAQAGQNISVAVTPFESGPAIAYSTGPNFDTYSGIVIALPAGGNLPLTSFQINPSQLTVLTQSGGGSGGALSFSVQVYLAAQADLKLFNLAVSTTGTGVQVEAAVGDQSNRPLAGTPTPFTWSPS